MRRAARAAAAIVAFVLLATPIAPAPSPGPGEAGAARLLAKLVPLHPDRPGERRLGPLRYLGGWELTSDDRRFGAISAMAVEGDRLLALSDQGILFRFPLPAAAEGTVEIMPIFAGPGDRGSKRDRDSESLAVSGGAAWVGFENNNEIWRYRTSDWSASAHGAPAAMRDWSENAGAEAMVRMSDGRFLVFAEHVDDEGNGAALLFAGDPALPGAAGAALSLTPPEGHRITDAAMLPDGRLLLLARGFSLLGGWSAKLLVSAVPRGEEQTLQLLEVATLASPLTRDNMEGLAVTREGARTIIWIASDDNLNPLQRTLLMKFEWVG